MLLEIDDNVVAGWWGELDAMAEMYADESRDDWFEADDIAKRIAFELRDLLNEAGA